MPGYVQDVRAGRERYAPEPLVREGYCELSYEPSFQFADTLITPPSVANLPAALTINGITELPQFRYNGLDATVSAWPKWGYGEDLAIAGAGADVVPNAGSPLMGALDDSVKGGGAKYFLCGDTSTGNVGTDDFVLEYVLSPFELATKRISSKAVDEASTGWQFYSWLAAGVEKIVADLYVSGVAISTISDAIPIGGWHHILVFLDRSGSAQIYINGLASGAAVDISSLSANLDNADKLKLLGACDGTLSFTGKVAHAALWKHASWLDTHLQATVAAERFYQLTGVWPNRAKGTPAPTVCTRNSARYVRKYNSATSQYDLYLLGANWPAIEKWRVGSEDIIGYVPEPVATNRILQSNTLGTTWQQVGLCVATNNTAETPSPDGTYNASRVDNLGAPTVDFIYISISGFTPDASLGCSFWIKRISTSGTVHLDNPEAGPGHWTIDLSVLPDVWVLIDRASPYVTVLEEFAANALGNAGFWLYANNGEDLDVYIWGCHQEDSAVLATSTITTTTAAVTRQADVLRYKGDDGNLGGVGSKKRGTIKCDIVQRNRNAILNSRLVVLSDGGAAADRVAVSMNPTGDVMQVLTRATGGSDGDAVGTTDVADGTKRTVRAAWRDGSLKMDVDGANEATDTACDMPDDLDRIDVGCSRASADQWKGILRNLRIYPAYDVK